MLKKNLLFTAGAFLLAGADLFAQSVSWTAVENVPMSTGALIAMALLLMAGGSAVLMTSRNRLTQSATAVLLAAGLLGIAQEARAIVSADILIDTPTGTAPLQINGYQNVIENKSGNVAVRLTVDPDGCMAVDSTCTILQPGERCTVSLDLCQGAT